MTSQYLYPSNIYKLKYNIIMMVLNANALVRWLGQEEHIYIILWNKENNY